jgi:hypothetical protein
MIPAHGRVAGRSCDGQSEEQRPTTSIAHDQDWHTKVGQLVTHYLDRGPRTFAAYARDLDEFAGFRCRSRTEAIADLLLRARASATQVAVAYAVHLRWQGRAAATVNPPPGDATSRCLEHSMLDW